MSVRTDNLFNNDDCQRLWPNDEKERELCGPFRAYQWRRDLSVDFMTAQAAYYASEMDVCRRMLVAELSRGPIKLEAGAMQMMLGNVDVKTNITGIGDLVKKFARSAVTDESVAKPVYTGNGIVVCEPTYKYLVALNADEYNGAVVLDDGVFLACEAELEEHAKPLSFGAMLLGNEGIFKLELTGHGTIVLESPCPKNELAVIELRDDVLKLDGNLALAWSSSLQFGVEKTTKSLMGSAVSGEGFVNVYRGTGRILVTPTLPVTRVGLGQ